MPSFLQKLAIKCRILWRDVQAAQSLRQMGVLDIVFYAGSAGDMLWVASTLEACVAKNMRCAVVVSGVRQKLPEYGCAVRWGSVRAVAAANASLVITASSGITPHKADKARWVHMPHSLVSLHMIYPEGAFNAYDVLFASGAHHEKEFALMVPEGTSYAVGYGKMDHLRAAYASHMPQQSDVTRIVVAPSWGPGNILEQMGEGVIHALLEAGYAVTVRPHPAFLRDDAARMDALLARFSSNRHFAFEAPTAPATSLFESDVMISDYSGVALEYAFLRERPVLFVDVPKKVLNPHWEAVDTEPVELSLREEIGTLVPAKAENVVEGVHELLDNISIYQSRIADARARYLYHADDCAAAAISRIETLLEEGACAV